MVAEVEIRAREGTRQDNEKALVQHHIMVPSENQQHHRMHSKRDTAIFVVNEYLKVTIDKVRKKQNLRERSKNNHHASYVFFPFTEAVPAPNSRASLNPGTHLRNISAISSAFFNRLSARNFCKSIRFRISWGVLD